MKLLYALFALLPLTGYHPAYSQHTPEEDVHGHLVPGKKRSLIAYTGQDHSFTMEVNASTAKVSDLPGFITIEGQIVQSTLVAPRSADQHTQTTAREKEVLTQYMNYELGYYKKKLHQNYTGLQTEWLTIKDRLFLVWYFDMPKDYKLVTTQLYFSTMFNGQVLDLNAPVFKTGQFAHARAVLNRLANTLKTYNKPVDLAVLKKQINK